MKRHPSNTASREVAAAQAAALPPLKPPAHVHLREGDIPFWNSIVTARAREFWTEADLENAASLARAKADVEKLQLEIDVGGNIVRTKHTTKHTHTKGGSLIVEEKPGVEEINPRHDLLERLTRRVAMLSRMLHVHAEATGSSAPDEKKVNIKDRTTRKVLQEDKGNPFVPEVDTLQ